jgi:hypothetical protein
VLVLDAAGRRRSPARANRLMKAIQQRVRALFSRGRRFFSARNLMQGAFRGEPAGPSHAGRAIASTEGSGGPQESRVQCRTTDVPTVA